MAQFRVKETLYTDIHPATTPFTGKIITGIPDSGYTLAAQRSVIEEKDAERWGIPTEYLEPYDPEQAAKDREAAAIATHGSQERAVANAKAGVTETPPEPAIVAPVPVAEPETPSTTPSDAGASTGPPVSSAEVLAGATEPKAEKPAHKKLGPKPKH